eukprot:TRINITY_DN4241_c0_g1_i6.p1 TRINITY_DN4241_c0_g1~~TRINITY_DN4241_c0_g1_i6.p1  ORF type:complete len:347 (-),score=72.81 TRINITY_DN4241_c0_g1_i6:128-1168(-)
MLSEVTTSGAYTNLRTEAVEKRKRTNDDTTTEANKKLKTETRNPKGRSASYKRRHFKSGENRNPLFEHGNYLDYYGYRNKGYCGLDPRLDVLDAGLFEGACCLDVGCNAGLVTLDLALVFGVRSVVGIDIDHVLIRKANHNLKRYSFELERLFQSDTVNVDNPTSVRTNRIQKWRLPQASKIDCKKDLQSMVTFQKGNYLQLAEQSSNYDVILCLSVTKWIHVNNGDEGVRKLFKKFALELKDGGHLILEPQPWDSYRPKKLSSLGKSNYHNLKLMPKDFQGLLESEGFTLLSTTKPKISVGGFSCRDVQIYRKDKSQQDKNQDKTQEKPDTQQQVTTGRVSTREV